MVRVSINGTLSLFAGNGSKGYGGDGGHATSAAVYEPYGLAIDTAGNVYIGDYSHRVRIVYANGTISTLAGNGTRAYGGDGGPATNAALSLLTGIALDTAGNVYIVDNLSERIRIVFTNKTISTFAGIGSYGYYGDGGQASAAKLNNPTGIAIDNAGNSFIADTGNNRIRIVYKNGTISTFAGNGTRAYGGDGGPATNAALNYPVGVSLDSPGNLYIADRHSNVIRVVDINGTISTFAGNNSKGFSGDNGPPTNAELNNPFGVAFDTAGNVYIADYGNNRIRIVAK